MCSDSQVRAIAVEKLREAVPCFSPSDTIRVEQFLNRIHIEYIAASATTSSLDATYLRMRILPAQQLMWIRDLRVATNFRSQGLGRKLTQAAAEVARLLGVERINVFPLLPARSFWERLGYRRHPRTTRVLTKHLNAVSPKE